MNQESTRSQKGKPSFSAEDFAKALAEHDYAFSLGQVVSGRIGAYTNDGVYVDIGAKSPGFLPKREAAVAFVEDLEELLPLDEEREFLIIREQDAEGQVTLSIRQLELKQIWDKLANKQKDNQSVDLYVTGVNKGGVTVDINGLRGFIPRSHLLEKNNPASLVGKNLTANILELDRDRNKLVFSQRQLAQSSRIGEIQVGQLLEGTVVSIKPFGVFVDVDGMTALLHINQVSKNYVKSLDDLFSLRQPIKAVVIDIDETKGRVSLSTKLLENHPGEIIENFNEVMDNAEARHNKISQTLPT
jgi:small subunit ribosomal protein S1